MDFVACAKAKEAWALVWFSQGQPKRREFMAQGLPDLPLAIHGSPPLPRALDTSLLSRAVWPELPDHSLPALCRWLGLSEPEDPVSWAEATGRLALVALEEVRAWPSGAQAALSSLLPNPCWMPPPKPKILPIYPRPPATLTEALARLAEAKLEQRPSQAAYAQAVAEALESGSVVVLEAGPGTGKTFGYLIPLLLRLREGGRAVVSTRTRTLQDQLWRKDLPWLEANLGLHVRRALLKGRENYLCRKRLVEIQSKLIAPEVIGPLQVWVERSESGDLDELGFIQDPRLIAELRDLPHRCGGRFCPLFGRCLSRRARERAKGAQLVVVNHALLGADLASGNKILGPYDYLVVDEAHALASVLRDALSAVFRPGDVPYLLGELRRAGTLAAADEVQEAWERVNAAQRRFWSGTQALLTQDLGELPAEPAIREAGQALWEALLGLAEEVARGSRDLEDEEQGLARALVEALRGRAEALKAVLSLPDPNWVHWYTQEAAGPALLATPLDVAARLREELWPNLKAAALTSATLAVGGKVEAIARELGLPQKVPFHSWPSPFSYDRVRSAVLAYLPDPDSEDYPLALAETLRRTFAKVPAKGLVLFTSRRTLAAVRSHLQGLPHLAQGWDGESDRLLARFRGHPPPVVLLGLDRFWEGVDLPGEDLEILVIARLPFPFPGDPVTRAESQRVLAQGGDDFAELFLPRAVLKFRQGVGRLVRSPADRGVILLADSRAAERAYAPLFLRSLPVQIQELHSPEELDFVLSQVFL